MEVIQSEAEQCRVATPHDAVLNSECCYTFHTPYTTAKGILVNLSTFAGTVDSMAMLYGPDTSIFVRIVKERVEKPRAMDEEVGPAKLAIGIEGGFLSEDDKYEVVSTHSVVVLHKQEVGPPLILAELAYTEDTKSSFPVTVQSSVDSVLNHVGVSTQQDVQAWQADEEIAISKYYADLPFCDNGVVIDPNPATWKCEKTGATENLWLNLSDGYIGGGRKNWDGSGGSNGALDHYEETGKKYPLVVKLGTITADLDTADCYSYAADEDGPVKIPNLAELLEKRGIKTAAMYEMLKKPVCSIWQKTVKSTAELEVELNANYAFDAITEAGSELRAVSGPGLQGLQNLGNSCYMNSIFQMLLSGTVPELAKRYGCKASPNCDDAITDHPFLKAVAPTSAPTDVLCQTSKLASALTSGVFAKPVVEDGKDASADPRYRLAPRMMKHCIGKDHVDFRTTQQQDAAQFLQYFLERLDRAELGASSKAKENLAGDPIRTSSCLFSFQTTARLACGADGAIKYKVSAPETILSLRVPMDKAKVVAEKAVTSHEQKKLKPAEESVDDREESSIPTIALQTCLEEWASDTTVDDIRWPHLGNASHAATQTLRLTNFPRYLVLQIQRYKLGPDWAPIKLELKLDIPEELDLTNLKSKGPQEGEILVPAEATTTNGPATASAPAINEAALSQLMDMGFSLNSCKRALAAVGGNDVEAAMGWVFEHNSDLDFNDPMPDSIDPMHADGDNGVDEDVVQSLVENLGAFTADQVRAALKETSGVADRAADWLFSHMDDIDGAIAALGNKNVAITTSTGPSVPLEDGEQGMYTLLGMVSHIGKNTGSGHYVAHLKAKDGKWVIFNDEKVALSSKPPFEYAYLYLYQRTDTIGSPMNNYY